MSDYTITTTSGWGKTVSELEESLRKWGATSIDINYPRGARLDSKNQNEMDRTVILRYNLRGKEVIIRMDKQKRAVDNLRVLYICIESMRMNERRGMAEAMESMYLQLAAPQGQRDPYEVLGIMRGTDLAIAEAVYRTMALKYHPDARPSGDADKFKEITDAINKIREELK